jgi:hypothetical protein
LWEETGCRKVIEDLAGTRKHGFPLERAVFLTVLHRLFSGGSDRAADRWREDYRIDGVEDLHHLCRAMAWLGEGAGRRSTARRYALRAALREGRRRGGGTARRRDLFSTLDPQLIPNINNGPGFDDKITSMYARSRNPGPFARSL